MGVHRQTSSIRLFAPMLQKIVSGGQTGADRAALDAALHEGLEIGGWCPAGRLAEDGRIPDRYPLRETPNHDPHQRTAWNVRDSDGTLVLAGDTPAGGTAFTIQEALRLSRPLLVAAPAHASAPGRVRAWLERHHIRVLNVAGPRASEEAMIYESSFQFLRTLFAMCP
jgi:predicted Rossmann-fold nucleotide-binding protein